MRFEERLLQPYSEPVCSGELQEGTEYFSLNYAPENMIVPLMETIRFVGRNLNAGDAGMLYFQEVEPHHRILRADLSLQTADEDPFPLEESQLSATFEFERALDGLLRCSLRRRGLDSQVPIQFDARELTSSTETVPRTQLKEGSVYFLLEYTDEGRLIPVMNTMVFIGRNLHTRDKGALYFEDFCSYAEGVQYRSVEKPDWTTFHVASEDEQNYIFEFEKALEELMRCSLRRRKLEE